MNEFATDPSSTGQAEGGQPAQAQPAENPYSWVSEVETQYGEKLTPDRFQEVYRGYKSHEQVQRQLAEETRFRANLRTDLRSVRQDPTLADKFKSIYPREYHDLIEDYLPPEKNSASALPREFVSKVDRLEQMIHQQAVESASAKLDAILPKLWERYPMANEDAVLAKAEAMANQKVNLTDAIWEKLAKENHEAMTKKADAFYKKQLQTQIDKGQAGKDAPNGGMVPGKAPAKPRTFQDAEREMIAHLKAQGMS